MYEHAEAIAKWVYLQSDSMRYTIGSLQGLLCLALGGIALQFWNAARWQKVPYRCERLDRAVYALVKSRVWCIIAAGVFVFCFVGWLGWLFVEYVSWTSPELRSLPWHEAKRFQRSDGPGRVLSILGLLFGVGCSVWSMVWLSRAHTHVRRLPPPGDHG
ncbi:MAG: hypothetical protein Q9O74_07785 [Planctomycetota bacterium]|nr:hypothetical protein [Planctomycetota bacterium]